MLAVLNPFSFASRRASLASFLACWSLTAIIGIFSISQSLASSAATIGVPAISTDSSAQTVTLATGDKSLILRLNLSNGCIVDQVIVRGRNVISAADGVYTGITAQETASHCLVSPKIIVHGNTLNVIDITYASGGQSVQESWHFTVSKNNIIWRIDRQYLNGGQVEDSAFPVWNFAKMDTWTGALLNTGGVAWCRLIPNGYSYGEHASTVTFWNQNTNDALRISTTSPTGLKFASRFTNNGDGKFVYDQSGAHSELATKYYLRRYSNTPDLWAPFQTAAETDKIDMVLQALDYSKAYGRGDFKGVSGSSVTELVNTIGRYGVIDKHIMGGNGWVSGYCCMHEPFFGEMGIAVDSPDFTQNLKATLNDWRTNALKPNGRVMARWCYDARDNVVPGTYNSTTGYYDCGWGFLLDAQPDYVINTAETFDLNGNVSWLRSQKGACESALNWLLARDFDHSGLMTMMTGSHTADKSSDWIDIVYACGKNALVNAEMYYALTLWSERETILGDPYHAHLYAVDAAKLKSAFIKPIEQGGFWDPAKGYFDYWREDDGSVHGDNLVTPVNFCAVAYGIADSSQSKSVLGSINQRMDQEKLFHWPLCFTSYKSEEMRGMMPFPDYENGDIFLSWGEVGVRSYASYKPEIAVHYVREILDQYQGDGLSYQRYLRNSQQGAGDDILAGNSMTIVGLYRDIYGIRPQWDRLLIDPHLTSDLYGTHLLYQLRNQNYDISLTNGKTETNVDEFGVTSNKAFAVSSKGNNLTCFLTAFGPAVLTVQRPVEENVQINISGLSSTSASHAWTVKVAKSSDIVQSVHGLTPGRTYSMFVNNAPTTNLMGKLVADTTGTVTFSHLYAGAKMNSITIEPTVK